MKSTLWRLVTVSLFVMVFGHAGEVSAQERVLGQIGAAITWNQFPDNSRPGTQQTFLDLGWTLSAARALTDRLSVAGEVGISANLLTSETTHRKETNRVYSALAGPRFTSHPFHVKSYGPTLFRVFGHLLVGAQTSDQFPGGRAIQPGGGIDISISHAVSFRSQFDHTFVQGQRAISGSRFLTGIVIDLAN